jgi:chaperone required for assembly of F1-ATPase
MNTPPDNAPKIPSKPLLPVTVEPVADGFRVRAGDRPWRTPAGADLVVPSRALADAIADELTAARFGGQLGRPRIDGMGLTRLAATAIDRIAPDPGPTRDAILAFAETDLVCYRVEGVAELRARQDAAWQPLLDWVSDTYGARLEVVEGVMPKPQSSDALDSLAMALARLDPFTLSGFGLAVQTAGSLIVGLALAGGSINAAEASAISDLDEAFQNEQWGKDAEALDKRRLRAEDLALAERFLTLLTDTNGKAR